MDLSTLICILVTFTLGCIWYGHVSRKRHLPPGPFYAWPTRVLRVIREPSAQVKLARTYGGIFSLPVCANIFIVLTSWESMKEAFVANDAFSDKPKIIYYVDKEMEDKDMLTGSGPANKARRQFVVRHLRDLGFGKSSMETIMLREISQLISALDEDDESEVSISELFHLPVLNILWSITAGKSFDHEDETMKEYLKFLEEKFHLIMKAQPVKYLPFLRFLPGDPFDFWRLSESLRKEGEYFDHEIGEHVESFRRENLRDFIDIYLDNIFNQTETDPQKNTCFDMLHLKGTLFSIFNAGFITTSTTLEWAMLYFVTWPAIQKKIQMELDNVVGRHRKPNVQDRPLMPYTEATIMEIQRFSTIVPTSIHKATKTTELMGYTIPKGTEMLRSIFAIHHDKSLWGDPDVFRPERFLDADGKVFKPEYFIPFSNGQRQCIAEQMARMELFLFIASLLQHFNFSSSSGKKPPCLKPIYSVIAKPQNYSVSVKQRPR